MGTPHAVAQHVQTRANLLFFFVAFCFSRVLGLQLPSLAARLLLPPAPPAAASLQQAARGDGPAERTNISGQ